MSDAGYSMLGAGAWGWPTEMLWGGRWEGGSCLGMPVRIKDFKIKKKKKKCNSFQLFSHVWFFETSWTGALQASLSITNSRSLLKLMSIESVMPPNHLILCHPFSPHLQSFPASESFQMSQLFRSSGQNIGVSASASVLPMNIQDWFSLGFTGFISLQSEGLSRVFTNNTVQKHQFFSTQLSL